MFARSLSREIALLQIALLLVVLGAGYLFSTSGTFWRALGGGLCIGISFAQLQVVALGFVFSTEPLVRRHLFFWPLTIVCMFGFACSICYSWLGMGFSWWSLQHSAALAFRHLSPFILIGTQLALWPAKFSGIVWTDAREPAPRGGKITLRELLLGLTVFGVMLGILRTNWSWTTGIFLAVNLGLLSGGGLAIGGVLRFSSYLRELLLVAIFVAAVALVQVINLLFVRFTPYIPPVMEYMHGLQLISFAASYLTMSFNLLLLQWRGWQLRRAA